MLCRHLRLDIADKNEADIQEKVQVKVLGGFPWEQITLYSQLWFQTDKMLMQYQLTEIGSTFRNVRDD